VNSVGALLLIVASLTGDGSVVRPVDPLVFRLPRANGVVVERNCPVHGEVMSVELVPIAWGLIVMNRQTAFFWHVMEHEFPNARTLAFGGCMVGPQRQAETYVCAKCVRARERWLVEHPAFHPTL
jgi:hypothetical protein